MMDLIADHLQWGAYRVKNVAAQKMKHDFEVETENGDASVPFEIKTDRKGFVTGNLALETTLDVDTFVKGWFWTSDAEYFCLVHVLSEADPRPMRVFCIRAEPLRQLVKEMVAEHSIRCVSCFDTTANGEESRVFLLPIEKARTLGADCFVIQRDAETGKWDAWA